MEHNNDDLVPYYIGDELLYVTVVESYYYDVHPEAIVVMSDIIAVEGIEKSIKGDNNA